MRIILKDDSGPTSRTPVPCSTLKRLRVGLGTFIAIEAMAGSQDAAEAAIEAAYAAIESVQGRMHPHSQGSDLQRINAAPLNTPIPVHQSTLELLRLAFQLNSQTDGVFDPCLPSQPGKLTDLELTTDSVLCRAQVAVDFGGFAKGFAVDCAIDVLREYGCGAGVVNAGGDLRVFGPVVDPIFIRRASAELVQVDLSDAALAFTDTSDSLHRPPEHQDYYVRHRPGWRPAGRVGVVASTACIADALTKCVLLCDPDVAERVLRSFGARRTSH